MKRGIIIPEPKEPLKRILTNLKVALFIFLNYLYWG